MARLIDDWWMDGRVGWLEYSDLYVKGRTIITKQFTRINLSTSYYIYIVRDAALSVTTHEPWRSTFCIARDMRNHCLVKSWEAQWVWGGNIPGHFCLTTFPGRQQSVHTISFYSFTSLAKPVLVSDLRLAIIRRYIRRINTNLLVKNTAVRLCQYCGQTLSTKIYPRDRIIPIIIFATYRSYHPILHVCIATIFRLTPT